MVRISIIIPFRDGDKLVDTTINSIKNQDYTDLEILPVGYGTSEISSFCDACNEGILDSEGRYIAFCDAGDVFLSKDAISGLVQLMEDSEEEGNPADILVCDHALIDSNGDKNAVCLGFSEFEDPEEYQFRFTGFFSQGHLSHMWGKLFRKDFLIDNELEFENLEYGSELLFSFCAHASEPVYIFSENCAYGRVMHPDKGNTEPVSEKAWLEIAAEFERYIRKKGNHPEYQDLCAYTLFFGIYTSAAKIYQNGGSTGDVCEFLKQCRKNDRIMRYINWLAAGRYIRKLNYRTYRTTVPFLAGMLEAGRYKILAGAVRKFMKRDKVRKL